MKIINLKVNSALSYYKKYVDIILVPFFKIKPSEAATLAVMYDAINTEVEHGVPLEAALRLISTFEYRESLREQTMVIARKRGNTEAIISEDSFSKAHLALHRKGLLDENYKPYVKHLIFPKDNGFGINISIDEQ